MLATASSVVTQLVNVTKNIALVLHIIMAIGFGGYQANVIQFGTDQLHDASTDEITSFIIWYVWTYFSSGIVLDFAYKCTSKDYHILGQLLVSISLTIAIISSILFGKKFVKENVTQNPFTLVYKVIRYAVKTKHPRCRSAFTYCEDDIPSRIDFGKTNTVDHSQQSKWKMSKHFYCWFRFQSVHC